MKEHRMSLKGWNIDQTWTLFLDRDGVINRRIIGRYVTRWEEFEFLHGVLEASKILARAFGRIVVVSNQQGIGKGIMTEVDLDKIHSSMVRQIEGARGRIDLVLFSPHLKEEGSRMRKPDIGMALEAKRKFPEIDFGKSVMAGDSGSDMMFGRNAGMKTILINNDSEEIEKMNGLYELTFPDLISFSRDLRFFTT
jgi:D-glycero-D-manno-heptose 1,7-bisphosphate phosphatase